MHRRQWFALVLVSMVAALHIGRESRDMARTLIYLNGQRWRPEAGQRRRRSSVGPPELQSQSSELAQVLQRASAARSSGRGSDDERSDDERSISTQSACSGHFAERSSDGAMPSIREESSPAVSAEACSSAVGKVHQVAPRRVPAASGRSDVASFPRWPTGQPVAAQPVDAAKPPATAKEPPTEAVDEEGLGEASAMIETDREDAEATIALEVEGLFLGTSQGWKMPRMVRFGSSKDVPTPGEAAATSLASDEYSAKKAAASRHSTSETEWEIFRLILLTVQNFRVLLMGSIVGCLPAFVMYDDVPVVINILLDAIAVLFILDIDDIVYDVVLHDKLKRAIEEQPLEALQEGTRRQVHTTRYLHFWISWLCVNLSILCVSFLRPSDFYGSYVVLVCCSVMVVLGALMQFRLLRGDTHKPSFAQLEDHAACWRRCLCFCFRDEATGRGCLPPRYGRLLLSWLLAIVAVAIVILPVALGIF